MNFPEIYRHLQQFRVGIAGAGGLGSNCAAALARCGIGSLVIADFDLVEPANLNRQLYFFNQTGMVKTIALRENIRLINPAINVFIHNIKLNRDNIPEIFAGCDVIVEALDLAAEKEMLIETILTKMKGVPLVVGSGMAGWGNTGSLRVRKMGDNLYVCGDEETEISDDTPPLAPRVGIVSHMQANTVIEILMERRTKKSIDEDSAK